jgi:uncharacterized membrane protein
MEKKSIFIISMLAIIFSSLTFISASDYLLQFNQEGSTLIINETTKGVSHTYTDSKGLERAIDGFYFVKKVVFSENFNYAEVKLRLDKGFVINTDEAYPTNFETSSDGQNILLIWRFYNVSNSSPVAFFVKLENTSMVYRVSILIIIILLIIIAAGLLVWFYLKKRRKASFDNHLMDSEKKVINELKKSSEREMWQKQLLLKTSFSKAKISRIIRDLEFRNIIKKIPYGNTNKISLK